LIFCSISISLLASLVAGRNPGVILVQISRECTPPYLSSGISNLLQPAKAEVVLGQPSTYLASWVEYRMRDVKQEREDLKLNGQRLELTTYTT
jgi:hypothetical protein